MNEPFYKQTWKFFKRLTESDLITVGVIAKVCGKSESTAAAWSRETPSLDNPLATGYPTPLDCVNRLLALAHKENAGLAREAAESFVDFVDHLDELRGAEHIRKGGDVQKLLAVSLKEQADILVAMTKNPNINWSEVNTETAQFETVFNSFKAALKEVMKAETEMVNKAKV